MTTADRLPAGLVLLAYSFALPSGCGGPKPDTSSTLTTSTVTETSSPVVESNIVDSASPNGVSSTQLGAFHRSGQTFITWPEDVATSGESYRVYRATSPITSSNLSSATRVASVPENSGAYANEVESGSPYQTRYIIEDEGAQLPVGVGLHVYTTHETGPSEFYYAVTEVRNGVEQTLQPNMTLTNGAGITEAKAMPQPVIVYTNGVKTLYTHWMDYSQWNPAFEGYAYNFWVGIPAEGNAQALPLQMHLHAWGESWQRYWTSGDAYGSGSPYDFQTIWIEPDDARNTWWYGFADNVTRGQAPDSSSTIVNYTEQRLDYYLEWITSESSPYLIDQDRIYLYGGSMGGSGTLSYGLRHPEWFAALYSLIGMTDEAASSWGRSGFDTLWGTVAQNLPTNEGVGVHDRMNMQEYLRAHAGDDLPYTVTFHGRLDTTIEWSTQGYPWVDGQADGIAAGPMMWADSDHSSSFDVYTRDLFRNYDMDGYRLEHGESYLVFTNGPGDDDPDGAPPACRGSAPYNYGYLGNSVEWASSANPFMGYSAPMDTSSSYQTALRIRTDLCGLPSSGTVDVTLRRAQQFRPEAGSSISWQNLTAAGQVLQSGSAVVAGDGLITVTGVQVSTSGSILSLAGSSGGGTDPTPTPAPGTDVDSDGDGYSLEEGDCDDADAAVYPGATEACNGIDDDCDTSIDEGMGLRCRIWNHFGG